MDTEVDVGELDLIKTYLHIEAAGLEPQPEFYKERGYVTEFCDAGWFARNTELEPHGCPDVDASFYVRGQGGETIRFEFNTWGEESRKEIPQRVADLDALIGHLVRFRNAAAGSFNAMVRGEREKSKAGDQSQGEQVQ